MKVTATVTEKELNDFYIYGKKLRENPCIGCPDKTFSCYCLDQRAWHDELESLPITSAEWDKYVDIQEYIKALLDITDTETEMNKLLKKQADLRDKIAELLTKFEVIDE